MAPQIRPLPPVPHASPPSILFVILDIHPLSWSLLASPVTASVEPPLHLSKVAPTPLSVQAFLDVLLVFLNAHLASRWGNEVVVYAATAGKSQLLYPPPASRDVEEQPVPNTYHPFRLLDRRFEDELKRLIAEEHARLEGDPSGLNQQPAIVSALTKTLCYINRILPSSSSSTETDAPGAQEKIEPRIMIINATPSTAPSASDDAANNDAATATATGGGGEMRGGYVGLMNCVFAAQKAKVRIDVLTLPPAYSGSGPPIFLQQASHLTEGVYWRWNGYGGLLQYLHSIYLVPPSLRSHPFAVPPQDAVDFRAVCFCHHNVVDVGFVCSVCLSIFCDARSSCQMCKTKFPIKAMATLRALGGNIDPIPIPQTLPVKKQPVEA